MLIKNIQIVDIVEGGWCNVKIGGNRWGVLFVRALPLWFTSIPGTLIACAAIIPSLIAAIKTRRRHLESQSETNSRNPTMPSRNQISREASNDNVIRPASPASPASPTSPTSPTSPISENSPSDLSPSTIQGSNKISNEAITRMALYCILYSAIGIPYSIIGLINFFNYWKETRTLDIEDTSSSNYLSAGIGMATLILIFLVFATNGSSIKQYKKAWIWWKFHFFSPIYRFITRRKDDSIRVDVVGNVDSNLEKESRGSTSISIRTIIPEENVNFSDEMQEELPTTLLTASKTKKRWSIFTASRESLMETEKSRKLHRSTEDTITSEDSSPTVPLFNQKMINRNIHNLSMSSSSTYSSATAIASEPSSPQNSDSPSKLTPILGGLSPAPRRTPPLSNPLRDFNDDKDDEIMVSPIKRDSPHILNNPRQTASAPTSPILTSRPNSMRISVDRYNQPRRFTSPLRRPSSPMTNSRSSVSTSTSYNQETPTTNTTFATFEDMQEEFDETEPFPSILKIGKAFNDEIGWRPASPLTLASRSIRLNSMSSNSNIWDKPDGEYKSGSPTRTGNLFRSGSSK